MREAILVFFVKPPQGPFRRVTEERIQFPTTLSIDHLSALEINKKQDAKRSWVSWQSHLKSLQKRNYEKKLVPIIYTKSTKINELVCLIRFFRSINSILTTKQKTIIQPIVLT